MLTDLTATDRAALDVEIKAWVARLERLCEYYRGVPGETARFTRDRHLLREIAPVYAERIEVIRELKTRLVRQIS